MSTEVTPPDALYSLEELAEILKLKPGTIRKYVARKKISAIHIGRFLRFKHEEVQRLLTEGTR